MNGLYVSFWRNPNEEQENRARNKNSYDNGWLWIFDFLFRSKPTPLFQLSPVTFRAPVISDNLSHNITVKNPRRALPQVETTLSTVTHSAFVYGRAVADQVRKTSSLLHARQADIAAAIKAQAYHIGRSIYETAVDPAKRADAIRNFAYGGAAGFAARSLVMVTFASAGAAILPAAIAGGAAGAVGRQIYRNWDKKEGILTNLVAPFKKAKRNQTLTAAFMGAAGGGAANLIVAHLPSMPSFISTAHAQDVSGTTAPAKIPGKPDLVPAEPTTKPATTVAKPATAPAEPPAKPATTVAKPATTPAEPSAKPATTVAKPATTPAEPPIKVLRVRPVPTVASAWNEASPVPKGLKALDANILLNGDIKGHDDMNFVRKAIEQARELSKNGIKVDDKLIAAVEAKIGKADFIMTADSIKIVSAYTGQLKAGLKDNVLSIGEYRDALTKMFGAMADKDTQFVQDIKGQVDDTEKYSKAAKRAVQASMQGLAKKLGMAA